MVLQVSHQRWDKAWDAAVTAQGSLPRGAGRPVHVCTHMYRHTCTQRHKCTQIHTHTPLCGPRLYWKVMKVKLSDIRNTLALCLNVNNKHTLNVLLKTMEQCSVRSLLSSALCWSRRRAQLPDWRRETDFSPVTCSRTPSEPPSARAAASRCGDIPSPNRSPVPPSLKAECKRRLRGRPWRLAPVPPRDLKETLQPLTPGLPADQLAVSTARGQTPTSRYGPS